MPIVVSYHDCHDPRYSSPVRVDSDSWFEWLSNQKSFRFECDLGNVSVIKDARDYWLVAKKIGGQLRRKRLGSSKSVTYERLREATGIVCLNALWKEHLEKTQSARAQAESTVEKRCEALEKSLWDAKQKIQALEVELGKVSQSKCDTDRLKAIRAVLKDYCERSKNTRDWTQANRLIEAINEVIG